MSLLFFIVSILTFGLSHWVARRTSPFRQKALLKIKSSVYGSQASLKKELQELLLDHKNYSFKELSQSHWVVEEKSSLFSFGCFYHLELTPQKNSMNLQVSIQPKLVNPHKAIPSPILEWMESFKLENAG